MPHEVRLMEKRRVIEAVFEGSVTIAERIDAMWAVVDCSRMSGVLKLLADFRKACQKAESQAETTAYAELLASEPTIRRMTIAYVGSREQTAGVEAVAALRGYFFQRFDTPESALRWLG